MNSTISVGENSPLIHTDSQSDDISSTVPLGQIVAGATGFSYQHPFSEEWCLRNLGFEIRAGEMVALVGESGSGKTTLIDCLTGFSPHFYRGGQIEGLISFLGEDIADADILKLARHYGRVSQDPRTQLFAQQVEDAIAFPMENKRLEKAEMARRMDQVAKSLHIEHIRDREATTLSGGEAQAVVIASMIVKDPEVMFFDDITSALDPRGQELVKEIISSLKGEGRTLFVIDPDFDWLSQVADRVIVLDKGRLVFNGSPQALMEREDLMALAGLCRPEVALRDLPDGSPAIVVDDVSFSYGDLVAVDGIDCTIQRNAVTGIVGHNGSGKSTLAKLLAGLLKPSGGSITVEGHPTQNVPAPDMVRRVGYLYQQPSRMFFNKSVASELAFTPLALEMESAVSLEQFSLAELADSTPYDLSAGQQQRLGLACVLSCDPEVIILDEPTQGLNQQGRIELVQLLHELQAKGKTILLISHDMYLVANATQDLVVMDHAKLVRKGPTKELLKDAPFFASLGLPLPWEGNGHHE